MRQGRFAERMNIGAPVFLTAVMEYLASEIMDLAGNIAKEAGKMRITPRHIKMAISNDPELCRMFAAIQISDGGVLSNIQTFLFPPKKGKAAAAVDLQGATQEVWFLD